MAETAIANESNTAVAKRVIGSGVRIAKRGPVIDSLPKAFEVARKLADGSQTAIRWTKYALNNWLRTAGPAFDTSLALEFMGFAGPDVREGLSSLRERRAPDFGAGDPRDDKRS